MFGSSAMEFNFEIPEDIEGEVFILFLSTLIDAITSFISRVRFSKGHGDIAKYGFSSDLWKIWRSVEILDFVKVVGNVEISC